VSSLPVVMYATAWCPFCNAARSLLLQKGVRIDVIDVDLAPGARAEMEARSGRRTVPQIFIDAYHVGGFDDLLALERAGELDALLTNEQP
jgi:glutaredoxin 3